MRLSQSLMGLLLMVVFFLPIASFSLRCVKEFRGQIPRKQGG